ncbi:MAG: PfkB family carbohydrate kinase [Candidatus Phosphoribacter sp.]|nr:ribokinase [Actinomycetales bacterium]
MARVVVLGSLNVDIVAHVETLPRPGETVAAVRPIVRLAGGKGGNQAVAAADAGANVVMVGAVGDDEAGRAYTVRLAGRGIFPRLAVVHGVPTGTAFVTVAASGANAIVVAPGANAQARAEVADLLEGDVLLCQLEVPVEVVAAAARLAARAGARVVINAAPYAALPADVLALADPLVVNEVEAGQLADSGAVPGSLLVTFGAAGASWDGERVDGVPVPAQQVLDTTGAGDAFCGALAAALARGDDRATALRWAATAGADAVRRVGAQPDPQL